MIAPRPFPKLYLGDHRWLHPDTFLHLLSREPVTPAAHTGLWEVRKRAVGGLKVANSLKHTAPRGRYEANSHAAGVHEVLATVEADHNRSEERRVGKECRSRWSP